MKAIRTSAVESSPAIENLEERRMMSVSYDASTGILSVYGSAGNDTINMAGGGNYVQANYTDERGAHSDTFWDATKRVSQVRVYGLDGNDTIRLTGSLPRTSVWGGLGDDVISGQGIQAGRNPSTFLDGNDGNDIITGSNFYNAIHGHAGNDTLTGGIGMDAIFGWDGNDLIRGSDGDDYLYGDNGDDNIDGSAGNDHIYGLAGNDLIHGGAGNDVINGGYGTDVGYGDDGDDFFEGCYDGSADMFFGGNGYDTTVQRDAGDFWWGW